MSFELVSGAYAMKDILCLIRCLIVLYRVFLSQNPDLLQLIGSLHKSDTSTRNLVSDNLLENLYKHIVELAQKYPGVYWSLELGHDWLEAVEACLSFRDMRTDYIMKG